MNRGSKTSIERLQLLRVYSGLKE